jgi:hypothetical protein
VAAGDGARDPGDAAGVEGVLDACRGAGTGTE